MSKNIADLFPHCKTPSLLVKGLAYDSRAVKPGDLFFAVPGAAVDGHAYVEDAAKRGAVAAVVERSVASSLPLIETPSVLTALSQASARFFDHPSSSLPVVGITGTNGKTTTTFLVEEMVRARGKTCGVMGTINYRLKDKVWPAPNTTPMSLDVQSFLSQAVAQAVDIVCMEVSSHALELHRVDDVVFTVGVFTNLTQDHLDFHKNMDLYFKAKSKLFHRPEPVRSVINIDDAYGAELFKHVAHGLSYGFGASASLRASEAVCNLDGIQFRLHFPNGMERMIKTSLLGRHNIYNALSAAGALWALDFSVDEIAHGLNRPHAVPGRLERVDKGQPFRIVVDYAHTPDALEQVLQTLRQTQPRKLFCVFGAGGDRDRTKRPKMGVSATKGADYVVVTSDNPRTEDPERIFKDIEDGIKASGALHYERIADRQQAIDKAVSLAQAGDIVLIAGKGHENYQIVGREKCPFSDVEAAAAALKKIGF